MSKSILEKDEEILWQSKVSFKPKLILFLFSLVVLIIGIVTNQVLIIMHYQDNDLLLSIFALNIVITFSLSLTGIIYTLISRFVLMPLNMLYFATNKRIINESEEREYNEFINFKYSEINKVEIRPRIFFKDRISSIRIYPRFSSTNPSEWRFQISKITGLKIPKSYCIAQYYIIPNISNYKPLLKILKHFSVKLTNK